MVQEDELDCESWAKRSVERVRDAGIRLQRLAREASDEFEENLRKELGEARKVSKFAYKWMKRVVDAGPQRAAWLRELRRTLDEAAIDRELHDGNIGGVEAARRRTRVRNVVAFGRDNCEKRLRPPASEVVALRQWARLAMCCRWRRRALGRNMQIDEPASRVRGAALAAAAGLARRLERADTVTWADIQAREARARAWWRRGGGHISKYVEELNRFEIHAGRTGDAQGRWLVEGPERRRGLQATAAGASIACRLSAAGSGGMRRAEHAEAFSSRRDQGSRAGRGAGAWTTAYLSTSALMR